ncbi:hypothetical protein C6P45_001990 [Maudiozyma exigua]|uniref:Copper-fist domain-containing protein n=1 Tax=Maudiozyma exigua TaxID=34358 RepID=A0A9P7BE27_MAUEX|nr:hypothetical protein C6P45_001990 [Kazachstania exigua]
MVLINGIKYACERCIRGHRVTTCNHADQPLMMIKPKGRPSTTCTYCKELRKSKGVKPPGTCTCGRQEKKRLAQKAKEEARAKAKELAGKNCTCSKNMKKENIDDLMQQDNTINSITKKCPVHSKKAKRSPSKRSSNKPRAGVFPKVNSSTSLDSNFLSASSILSDSSNHLSTSFIDSDILQGKITKDYHHVPSLASISSLQSSNSLDQNISTPQSPPLGAMQFNFITGGYNQQNNNNNNNGATTSSLHNVSRNWDGSTGKTHSNNTNRSSSQININTMNVMPSSNLNNTYNNVHTNSNNGRSSFHIGSPPISSRSALASPPLRPNPGAVIVPLEEFVPPDLNGVGKVTDSTSYVNDWALNGGENSSLREFGSQSDSRKSSIVPSVTSNDADDYSSIHQYGKQMGERQPQASNGLLDMFLDSSSMSTLSKANVLLQEKDQKNNNNNNNHMNNNIEKNNIYNESFYPNDRSRSQRTAGDNDSVRSVEVLSLTPSFMDIPGNHINPKRKGRPGRDNMSSQVPISNSNTQSTNSNLNIMQDVPQTVPRFSNLNNEEKFINDMTDPHVNPVIGTTMYDNFDANMNNHINSNNNHNNKYPMTNENMATNNNKNMFNNNTNNGNVSPNDMDMNNIYSSDLSPNDGLQFSSPPSQLLSEQGFADLDNFMSTL